MKHFVRDSYFDVVADVNDTWAKLKGVPDYKKDFGIELFTRMFAFAPAVWKAFPWGHGIKAGEDFSTSKEFTSFARSFVGMLDMAIDMLGPDMDLVEEQLQHLGVAHIDFGVMPKHYPLMGRALTDAMASRLGDRFTPKHRESWNTVYTFMSVSMMQGAFQDLTKNHDLSYQSRQEKRASVASTVELSMSKNEIYDRRASVGSTTVELSQRSHDVYEKRASIGSTMELSVASGGSLTSVMEEGVAIMVTLPLGDQHEYSVLLRQNELFTNVKDVRSVVHDWEDVIVSAMANRLHKKLRRTSVFARVEQILGRLSLEAKVQDRVIPIDAVDDLIYCLLQLRQQDGSRDQSQQQTPQSGNIKTLHLVYDTDDLEIHENWDGRNFDFIYTQDVPMVPIAATINRVGSSPSLSSNIKNSTSTASLLSCNSVVVET